MSRIKDETGNRYGKLTVLRFYKTEMHRAFWVCRCDCGNEFVVSGDALRSGNTKSCGCLKEERLAEYHRDKQILLRELRDCRAALCEKCGGRVVIGACDGCRWRADND